MALPYEKNNFAAKVCWTREDDKKRFIFLNESDLERLEKAKRSRGMYTHEVDGMRLPISAKNLGDPLPLQSGEVVSNTGATYTDGLGKLECYGSFKGQKVSIVSRETRRIEDDEIVSVKYGFWWQEGEKRAVFEELSEQEFERVRESYLAQQKAKK